MLDLEDCYLKSVQIVKTIDKYEDQELNEVVKILAHELKVKCMENVVCISLINKLQKKYPQVNLDVELFLEGVQID